MRTNISQMRTKHLPAVLALGLALACAAVARAEPLPTSDDAATINAGLDAMRQYNLIVLKDLKSNSEVEGRTFVGGNLSGNSSNYFTKPGSQSGGVGLAVAGNVTGGTKQVNNGAALQVGGNLDSGANMNGGGQVRVDGNAKGVNANNAAVYVDGDIKNINAQNIYYGGSKSGYANGTLHAGDHSAAGLQADLQQQATDLADELTATSDFFSTLTATNAISYSANGQQAIFNAGSGSGIAVFSISDLNAALKNSSQLIFNLPTTYDAVIVNVAGTNVSLPSGINFNGPNGLGQKVIWNFYEATSINFGSKSWYGWVLAPGADLKIGNFIEGSVVARSLTQNGEIHLNGLGAGLIVQAPQAAVPEPATWTMLILGFGAIGAALRRRRALAAT